MKGYIDLRLHQLLDDVANQINQPEFILNDPIQFPRKFSDQRDIEIAAFLSAIIAWGKRSMICRDANRLFNKMDWQPYSFMMNQEYENFDDNLNIHRTLFFRHLKWLLRGLREIYIKFGSLDNFSFSIGAGNDDFPAWKLVSGMQENIFSVNNGSKCSECLPANLDTTALKRINMALRWLVRNDGIVDIGIWKSIRPGKLYIPLDVHVGNTARKLNLLTRKSNDRKSVVSLTRSLAQFRPDDPTFYDFALFGIGVNDIDLSPYIGSDSSESGNES